MQAKDSSFWKYEVYAGIGEGSSGRGVKWQSGGRQRQFLAI